MLELGSYEGNSSVFFLKHFPKIKLTLSILLRDQLNKEIKILIKYLRILNLILKITKIGLKFLD